MYVCVYVYICVCVCKYICLCMCVYMSICVLPATPFEGDIPFVVPAVVDNTYMYGEQKRERVSRRREIAEGQEGIN